MSDFERVNLNEFEADTEAAGAEIYSTTMNGLPIYAAHTFTSVIGVYYLKAGYGSFNESFKGDLEDYCEQDTLYPKLYL